jgi:hypothetical protein
LFLGIPGNAPPLPPSVLFSAGEPNDLASTTTAAPTITQRHNLLTTHFLDPTMTMRSRTRSDSPLLLSAPASGGGGAAEEEHDDDGKRSKVIKTKRGEKIGHFRYLWLCLQPLGVCSFVFVACGGFERVEAAF